MSETPTIELPKLRDIVRQRSPTWLQIGLAEKILYAIGVHCDALGDALVAGIKQRFPGAYTFESLPLLSRERRIARGLSESDESFAARLQRWLVDHQKRGGPYALLSQLFYHYRPAVFPIELRYYNGPRYTLDDVAALAADSPDNAIIRDSTSWSADSNAAKWARWWLFYYTDQWAVTPPTDAEVEDLRLIPRAWNAGHPIGTIVLVSTGSDTWNALDPDEDWNSPGDWNSAGTPRYIEVEP